MSKILPKSKEPERDDRVALKVAPGLGKLFTEGARARKQSATEYLQSLMDAASSGSLITAGSLADTTEKLDTLESRQAVLAETAIELCAQLVTLSARLDDGGAGVMQKLSIASEGGDNER